MDSAKGSKSSIAVDKPLYVNDRDPFPDSSLYRNTIGALQYVMLTRPGISFVVNHLSQFLHSSTTAN